MAKQQVISSITALPKSPQEDRRARMVKYLVTMGIRLVCIALCFVTQGWWQAVFIVGAIVLPYLAVIAANVGYQAASEVLRPGAIVPVGRPRQDSPGNDDDRPGDAGERP